MKENVKVPARLSGRGTKEPVRRSGRTSPENMPIRRYTARGVEARKYADTPVRRYRCGRTEIRPYARMPLGAQKPEIRPGLRGPVRMHA